MEGGEMILVVGEGCGEAVREIARAAPPGVVYMVEREHLASLTVAETLQFAEGMGGVEANEGHQYVMGLVGLTEVQHTKLGDTLHRGTSSGEGQRAAVCEGLLSRSPLLCLRQWSLGLDGPTARRVAHALRSHVTLHGLRCVAGGETPPPPDVLALFDRVLTLPAPSLPRPALHFSEHLHPAPRPPVTTELRWLLWREVKLLTRRDVAMRLGRYVVQSVVLGILFHNLSSDQSGAYNRLGLLFNLMLAVSLGTVCLIPSMLRERQVVATQAANRVVRPVLWMATKIAVDLPTCLLEALTVVLPVFFLAGLRGAGNMVLILWPVTACMGLVVRTTALLIPSPHMSQAVSGGLLVLLAFFSGFLVPTSRLPAPLAWIPRVSPFSYAYNALLANEFASLTLHCNPSETIPPSDVPPPCSKLLSQLCHKMTAGCVDCAWEHRDDLLEVCPSVESVKSWCSGAVAGYCPPQWEHGMGYLNAVLSIPVTETVGGNAAVLWCMLTVMCLAAVAVAPHALRKKEAPGTEDGSSDERLSECSEDCEDSEEEEGGVGLAWQGVEHRHVLKGVDGWCRRGDMVAVVGASGSGKTTLLDVLSRNSRRGIACGYAEWERGVSPHDTVEEATGFRGCGKGILKALGLSRWSGVRVGALPPNVRKMVGIAVELAGSRGMPLLVDEPTTSLPPAAAQRVMRVVRKAADRWGAVVSIHQPTPDILALFDAVLVLSHGYQVYWGPPHGVAAYWRERGVVPRDDFPTPVETMIGVVASLRPGTAHHGEWRDTSKRLWCSHRHRPDGRLCCHEGIIQGDHWSCCGVSDKTARCTSKGHHAWAAAWRSSEEGKAVRREAARLVREQRPTAPPAPLRSPLRQLLLRKQRAAVRFPVLGLARVTFAAVGGVVVGGAFYHLGDTQHALHSYVTLVVTTIFVGVVGALCSALPIFDDRLQARQEVQRRWYSPATYAAACVVAEIPLIFLTSLSWCCTVYWLAALPPRAFPFFFASVTAFTAFMAFFGLFVASVSPSLFVAEVAIPVFQMLWSLHCGFLILSRDIPSALRPLHLVNPFTYFLRSTVATLLHAQSDFTCAPSELLHIPWGYCGGTPTPTLTPGMLATPATCAVCPVTSGDGYAAFFGFSVSTASEDLVGMVVAASGMAALFVLVVAVLRP